MRKICILLLFVGIPCLAYSQEPELDVRIQLFDGKEFICFEKDTAKGLLQLRLDYIEVNKKVTKLARIIVGQEHEIGIMNKIDENNIEQIVTLTKENINLYEKIRKSNAWYNSSYFWASVGLVAGVLLTIAISKGGEELGAW